MKEVILDLLENPRSKEMVILLRIMIELVMVILLLCAG